MSSWVRRVLALVCGSMLVLAACGGSDRDEAADVAEPGASVTTGGGSDGEATFGDLPSPCGPGEPTGSPDQGVDAATVTIGFGDDAGYSAAPGLGSEASDAVRALIDWCNEQGGINGREVVGNYYDAKITEMANVMTEACSEVFMLVGQFWALPESAEVTRLECGLPAVPGVISGAALSMAPLMVSPYPQPIDQYNVGAAAIMAEQFPEEVTKAAVFAPVFPNITDTVQRFQRTVPEVGWEFLGCDQTYPITGVADFRPYLQSLKDCGVEVVFTLDLNNGMQNILDAAAQMEFDPIWLNVASAYTESFGAWNVNGYADDFYFGDAFVPLDHTPDGSANALYAELVEAAGGSASYAGQVSASAFLLWATAAEACGDDLTRDCVMEELRGITEWDGGGLSTPQNPGENVMDTCMQVMTLDGPTFEQWQPAEPGEFACDPSWRKEVAPPIDTYGPLQIGPDRVATNILAGG